MQNEEAHGWRRISASGPSSGPRAASTRTSRSARCASTTGAARSRESDTLLFTTLTLSFNPLYSNRVFAQAHGHPDIVVNPLLVFNVVLGMSVEDNSEIGGPFVGVGKLTHHQPVYPGDTLVARSTTAAARLSASNPANGIVTWWTEGFNQRDELVIDFERSNLVRLRNPPRAGGDGMKLSDLTGKTNYFEDFHVGDVIRHARGKTIEGLENVLITNLVMNTAQSHFNEHSMRLSPYGGRLSYGGVNFSVAMGLAMQDCRRERAGRALAWTTSA